MKSIGIPIVNILLKYEINTPQSEKSGDEYTISSYRFKERGAKNGRINRKNHMVGFDSHYNGLSDSVPFAGHIVFIILMIFSI